MLSNIISHNPDFWSSTRTAILETVCKHSRNDSLDQDGLKQVISDLASGSPYSQREILIKTERVLTEANESGHIDAVVPPIPQRLPRPSIFPGQISSYSQLPVVRDIYEFLLHSWLATAVKEEEFYLALVLQLSRDGFLTKHAIKKLLPNLAVEDLVNGEFLALPLHHSNESKLRSYIPLSATSRLVLNRITHMQPAQKGNKYLFFPERNQTRKTREEKVFKIVKRTYRKLSKEYFNSSGVVAPSLTEFLTLSPLLAWDMGVEPFIFTAFRKAPLPASNASLRPGGNDISWRTHIPAALENITVPTRESQQTSSYNHDTGNYSTDDWEGRAKRVLRALLSHLGKVTPKTFTAPGHIRKAKKLIDDARLEADKISCPRSALHLAINWVEYKLLTTKSTRVSTISSYCGTVFYDSIFRLPDSHDLDLWEPEDHERCIESKLLERNLKPGTRKNYINAFSQFYKFAASRGYVTDFEYDSVFPEFQASATRDKIVSPNDFDLFIFQLFAMKTPGALTIAAASILGFYAGLRPEEVNRIAFGDIEYDRSELVIHINRGKTPAARRTIYLHLFASPKIIEVLTEYLQYRRSQFSDNAITGKLSVFGPDYSRDRFSRKALISPVIKVLKYRFGEDTVFYTLRHSFASWMLLRWYCAKHRDAVDLMPENTHLMFQRQELNKVAKFFTRGQSDSIPDVDPTALIHIAKLMGHADTSTLFRYYVHTFHHIQAHAVHRLDKVYGETKLKGKVITNLVPKLKSRSSQSKLKDRTIAGLADYIRR